MEEISLMQRDIVLLPFPFSNQEGTKVRPAVVLSNNSFNRGEDVIVSAVTSNVSLKGFSVLIDAKDLELKNIRDGCCVKVESILKIDKRLVMKQIDRLKPECFARVRRKLDEIF